MICCLIWAVLYPVGPAALDPGLELYKINFNFQSKILFNRISYAYSSTLDNSDPSVFFLLRLFLMAIDSNPDPFPILYCSGSNGPSNLAHDWSLGCLGSHTPGTRPIFLPIGGRYNRQIRILLITYNNPDPVMT